MLYCKECGGKSENLIDGVCEYCKNPVEKPCKAAKEKKKKK